METEVVAPIMGWVDITVFSVMLAVSTLIGVYFAYCAPNSTDTDDQYLVGGRSMGTVPIGLSLFASFISGIALLGYPAEVYVYGGQVLYNAISYPMMGWFVGYQLLPVFRELKGLSLYEYFDHRFDRSVRTLASCLFVLSHVVWLPIVMYVPALAFEQVTKIDLHIVGPIVCIVCIYYTTEGGVKAVVWTDAVQATAMLGCILLVAVKGTVSVGGPGVVWERNVNTTRLEGPVIDLDPTTRHTIFSLLIGGVFRHTADVGFSQSIIQRYMALPSWKHCLRATAIFIACTVGLNVCACYCGLVAAAYYHDCDPLSAGTARARDQILPLFVLETLSDNPGLTGIFIAGVFSAAMSSLSTGLNSLSAVVLEDWLRSGRGWNPTPRQTGWILKGVVMAAGLVCLALMFVVEHLGMVMQLNTSLLAMAAGPMVTLFVAGLFLPWVNTKSALLGAAAAAALVGFMVIGAQVSIATDQLVFPIKPVSVEGCPAALNATTTAYEAALHHDNSGVLWMFRLSYLWYQPLAVSIGLLVSGLAALAGWRNDPRDVNPLLLAPLVRRFVTAHPRGQQGQQELQAVQAKQRRPEPAQEALLKDIQRPVWDSERRGSN